MEDKVSTLETSNNWNVQVGKKQFTITQNQYNLVLEALNRDVKMIHFGDYSINLSYISFMEKIQKAKIEEIPESTISDEQAKLNREKIAEMKKKVLGI